MRKKKERKVIILSERYRRRSWAPGFVPAEGAEIIGFEEGSAGVKRRRRFEEYSFCFLRMETECTRLMHERRHGGVFSAEPLSKAVQEFIVETSSMILFLMRAKEERSTHVRLGFISEEAARLRSFVGELRYLPTLYTREMGDVFYKIGNCLSELRAELGSLLPLLGVPLPVTAPAYKL